MTYFKNKYSKNVILYIKNNTVIANMQSKIRNPYHFYYIKTIWIFTKL